MKNVLKALNYIPGVWKYIAAIISLNILAAAIGTIQPFFFKHILDTIVSTGSRPESESIRITALALAAMLGLRMLNSVIDYFVNLRNQLTYYRIYNGLKNSIFERVTTLSTDYFEQEKTGAIVQRYSSGTSDIARWINGSLGNFLPQIFSVIFALIIIFHLNILIGVIVLVSISGYFALQIPTLIRTRPIGKEARKHWETATGYFTETVHHISTVRSFGGESSAVQRQMEELNAGSKLWLKRFLILQRSVLLRQMIVALATVSSLAIIAMNVIKGRNTAGDVLLLSLYLQQIMRSLWPIGIVLIESNEIDITAERIIEMLETKPTVNDREDAIDLQELKTVEFRNVTFSYPGKKRKALDKVSFKIEPGQTMALVGPSGTGKTTITKLILRFYEPTRGEILINDRPISTFTQDSIRRHIGVVMQDVALFNDTIEANLQLANPKALRVDVKAAAEQAHADVFIEKLPEKYSTLVGERGVKLSGGEKQRVAIARAILKDPQMIILDEATSALDSESERHVQAGLSELMEGRTAVIIAHRLSTVMQADQIVVMKDGKIVETGTHDDLKSKAGGLYARLFKLQTEGFVKA